MKIIKLMIVFGSVIAIAGTAFFQLFVLLTSSLMGFQTINQSTDS
jgi:hypothetical protein